MKNFHSSGSAERGRGSEVWALCAQAEGYSSMQSAMDMAAWTRQLTVTNSLKIACNCCDIWRKKESLNVF